MYSLISITDCGEIFRAFNNTIYTDTQLRIKLAWAFALFENSSYPGCVDKSELSFVMAKAGFPFSLEDHANAVTALTNYYKEDKIYLNLFIEWWFDYAFRREWERDEDRYVPKYNMLGADNNIAGGGGNSIKNKLVKVMKERKETEIQVKQLKARISLLQKNEIKTWREIKNTKNKIMDTLKSHKEEEERGKELIILTKEKNMQQMEAMESQDKRYVELGMYIYISLSLSLSLTHTHTLSLSLSPYQPNPPPKTNYYYYY